MLTCTKRYHDLPFAHRAPNHDGHCAHIHGHNWSFEFEFSADKLDDNGFVVDFGKLKWLKKWLEEMFDHTLLLAEGDELIEQLGAAGLIDNTAFDIRLVPDTSSEGLAMYVFKTVDFLLAHNMGDRYARVTRVTVYEDSRNSATYHV